MGKIKLVLVILSSALIGGLVSWWITQNWESLPFNSTALLSPLSAEIQEQVLPLNKYGIDRLSEYPYSTSPISIERELDVTTQYSSYLFSYRTMGKKMTGVLNVPADLDKNQDPRVIIMLRGYVPLEIYESGVGTKNAASYFAERGFITIAPDFFGYGESDPEFTDEWEARFAKPVQVIELMKSIQEQGIPLDGSAYQQVPTDRIGMWAHSNGGQIALTVLEILQQPIPTTLWAPVTAPFPYSVLFFSDEAADEGKQSRAWIGLLEDKYDVFQFSLTQHLDKLTGPILLHHGTADDAALIAWSDEFVDKIAGENDRREFEAETTPEASVAANNSERQTILPEIDLTYHRYPGADHNLRPVWDTVVARDLIFFSQNIE